MGRNVFWGETSYLCKFRKKVGRNVFWGETSRGEMSFGEKRLSSTVYVCTIHTLKSEVQSISYRGARNSSKKISIGIPDEHVNKIIDKQIELGF